MQLAGDIPPAFLTFALWHLPVPVPGGGAGDAPAANQAVPERANEGGAALRGKRRGNVTLKHACTPYAKFHCLCLLNDFQHFPYNIFIS